MKFFLDTNAAIYLLGDRLAEPLPAGQYFVSVVTEMELLCYPAITPSVEAQIHDFLSAVTLVELTPDVRAVAIDLRRRYPLKLPDAIVAASALRLQVPLLTNDVRLQAVAGLSCQPLVLRGD